MHGSAVELRPQTLGVKPGGAPCLRSWSHTLTRRPTQEPFFGNNRGCSVANRGSPQTSRWSDGLSGMADWTRWRIQGTPLSLPAADRVKHNSPTVDGRMGDGHRWLVARLNSESLRRQTAVEVGPRIDPANGAARATSAPVTLRLDPGAAIC
jgi:hypothetical protein